MASVVTIAVVGATGRLGKEVVRLAVEEGVRVIAMSRTPETLETPGTPHDMVVRVAVDVTVPGSLTKALIAHKPVAVVSCFGMDCDNYEQGRKERCKAAKRNKSKAKQMPLTYMTDGAQTVVDAVRDADVPRLVYVSVLGAGDSAAQLRKASRCMSFFFRNCFADVLDDVNGAEEVVARSSVDFLLARPAILSDKKPKGLWREAAVDEKVKLCVPRKDVAAFLVREALTPQYHKTAVTIGR